MIGGIAAVVVVLGAGRSLLAQAAQDRDRGRAGVTALVDRMLQARWRQRTSAREQAGAARERGTGGGLAPGPRRSRSAARLLTLFFVLVFNFFLFRVLPADPART